MWPLWVFLACLVIFHASEYALAAIYMRDELSIRCRVISMQIALLITRPYLFAMVLCFVEYFCQVYVAPGFKQMLMGNISLVGLALVLAGELLRKTAMITAQHNFTHDIQRERRAKHRLVTHGIYRYIRHPGYLGWYLWVVGGQLLLANPVCTVLFTLVVWRFFAVRIRFEEHFLRDFFGDAYSEYAARTRTGIPFIN